MRKVLLLFVLTSLLGTSEVLAANDPFQNTYKIESVLEFDSPYGVDPMGFVMWDGNKYIATEVQGKGIYTSTDGLEWNMQPLDVWGVHVIAFNGKVYSAVGDFTPIGKSAIVYMTDENGNRISYNGTGRNQITMDNKQYEINVAASSDGFKWDVISGNYKQGTTSWVPGVSLRWDGEEFLLLTDDEVFTSLDGITYTHKGSITITDPRNLTPEGYSYLGSKGWIGGIGGFDDEYYYTAKTDYFGFSILRSKDAVNWEVVYFDSNKKTSWSIAIHKGSYVILRDDSVMRSADGAVWKTTEKLSMPSLIRKLDLPANSAEVDHYPPAVHYYKGFYYMMEPNNKNIVVTKDFKNFSKITSDGGFKGSILFIDEQFIITTSHVYHHLPVGIADAVKVKVNDKYLKLEPEPVNENGTIFVPPSPVFQALGAKVDWNGSYEISRGDDRIVFNANSPIASVNGKEADMGAMPKTIKGQVLIPLRFISQVLGNELNWDEASKIVTVSF